MRVRLRLDGVVMAGTEIGLLPTHALLDALLATRSVSGAAVRLGVSYRTAWDRIGALQAAFGCGLVAKVKGHGSSLTPEGARLHGALDAVLRRYDGAFVEAEAGLAAALAELGAGPARRLTLAASHDPTLFEALAGMAATIAATTTGSAEAVAKLLAGTVDLAGFHFGAGAAPADSPFADVHADPAFAVVALFRREQGLLLPPGNPHGIRSVPDIAAAGVRFVNRQRGSGTRLWFDRLLAAAGLAPQAIHGYEIEEFTHQAVAAVIASGAAGAGMGVRAAADRFGLAFVPLGLETYYLATRAAEDGAVRLDRIAAELRARLAVTP